MHLRTKRLENKVKYKVRRSAKNYNMTHRKMCTYCLRILFDEPLFDYGLYFDVE
jgi:hypothetical protein